MGRVSTDHSTEPADPEAPDSPAPDTTEAGAPAAPRRRVVLLAVVAAAVLALDIASKVLVVATLTEDEPNKLLGGALYLTLLRNPGAAFNLATGMTWVLALIALAVVGFIIWIAPKLRSVGWAVGLGLVLGGALGNLVDRIFRSPGVLRGHVVDFISLFGPYGHPWPVFNLADSGICVGGAVIVLMALLQRDYDGTRTAKAEKTQKADTQKAEQ
jgi:signal peptidase II